MSGRKSPRRQISFPKQFANFTNTTAGLDLTLRLLQALTQVAAEVCVDDVTVKGCLVATSQLNLARRYLRFFALIDCFSRAYSLLLGDDDLSEGGMLRMTGLVESSCLGMFILLENLTMLHDMNIWLVPWYTPVLMEASKFWFYAISASITGTVWRLFFGSTAQKSQNKEKSKSEKPATDVAPVPSTMALLQRIVADGCDLALPASFLGWIAVGDLGIGLSMVVSTLIVSQDAWTKAQQ